MGQNGCHHFKKLRSVPTDTDFEFYYKMLNVKSTVPIVFLSTVGFSLRRDRRYYDCTVRNANLGRSVLGLSNMLG